MVRCMLQPFLQGGLQQVPRSLSNGEREQGPHCITAPHHLQISNMSFHMPCLDSLTDAFQAGACNMASSLAACLHSMGFEMPRVHDVVPLVDVNAVVEALTERLHSTGSGNLYCLRAAPTQGVVSCTYEQWFEPYSLCRRHCQLPVSGRRMQQFLQFRLGCHGLPIATGRLASADHVDRANRVCLACNSGAVVDEKHMIFVCTALAPLRQQHADLFTPRANTMHSFSLNRTIWGF